MTTTVCLDCNTPSHSPMCECCWAVRHNARFIADEYVGVRVTLPYSDFLKLRPKPCERAEAQPTLEAAQNKIDQLSEEIKHWRETSENRTERLRELLASRQETELSLSRCQAELAAAKAELSKFACPSEGVSRFALLEVE